MPFTAVSGLSEPRFRDAERAVTGCPSKSVEESTLISRQRLSRESVTDPIAERVRKVGETTVRSIGHIARMQRVLDNNAAYVEPGDMLSELMEDNKALATRLRETHNVCEEARDIAAASLIEVWIDETECRTWFLFEAGRRADSAGH